MTHSRLPIPRRHFLGGLAAASAALALPGASLLASEASIAGGPDDWDHSWLNRLTAKHRPFFENKTMGGDTLAYPKRYYDAMLDGYGASPKDVAVIIGFSGAGWPVALSDEKWAAWGLTANGGTGNPPGKNPVRGDAADDAATATSLMAWKKRGATLLICNNALHRGSTELAARLPGGDAQKIYTEMRASILPEFIVVPALVAALAMAQEHDCPYLVGS